MFFVSKVVLVEGPEDVAYLMHYLHASDQIDELRSLGVGVVPTSSKSGMIQAVAIARCLGIPCFAIWDSDGQETRDGPRKKHEADNVALQKLFGVAEIVAFPDSDVFEASFCSWREEASARFRADCGERWSSIHAAACDACGHAADLGKHALFISELLIAAMDEGVDLSGLATVADRVVSFAREK